MEAARVAEGLTVKQAMRLWDYRKAVTTARFADERLSRAWPTRTLGAAPRGTAGDGAQASGSGTSLSSCLRVGVGEDDRKFGWEQPNELLPDAQERRLAPAQTHRSRSAPGGRTTSAAAQDAREDQLSFAERLYRLRERRWREASDRLCDRVLESV